MYGTRFWDYSFINMNLNGRICIKYSIFWGILAWLLIKYIKPLIDKLINKIPNIKALNSIIIILIIIDCISTVWAIKVYQNRVVTQYYNIEQMKENTLKEYIENALFSNDKVKKTFPNLRYIDENGKEFYLKELIKEKSN